MTTSSPIHKIHEIPIVRITHMPRELPALNPERIVPMAPIRKKETVRIRK